MEYGAGLAINRNKAQADARFFDAKAWVGDLEFRILNVALWGFS